MGQRTKKTLKEIVSALPDNFTFTAHTGCMNTKDNSLDSIVTGIKSGASVVEFDLHFNKEGNAVLSHDKPVGGEVSLEEAFSKIAEYDDILVNVDVKPHTSLHQVVAAAEKTNMVKRIFYTGIEEVKVPTVNETSPGISYYLNMKVKSPLFHSSKYIEDLIATVKKTGAVGINFNKRSASQKLVDAFHKAGLLVSIFTVDKEKEMLRILHLSPDNITTRNPDKLNKILKENGYVRN